MDDDMVFDPSKKKKKKKKATDLNELLAAPVPGESVNVEGDSGYSTTGKSDTTPVDKVEDIVDDNLDDFTFTGKKKKKSKKAVFLPPTDLLTETSNLPSDQIPAATDSTLTSIQNGSSMPVNDELDDELKFDFSKKKKKPKKSVKFEGTQPLLQVATDAEYTYEQLLERVFNIMKEKNPEALGGEKKKIVIGIPQVMRVGTKKVGFTNFSDICKQLHRQPKHLISFLFAELGTNGSVDGSNHLIIKGRFTQKQLENVLRKYIKEYVTCHTCKSPDTVLKHEKRLTFLECETCESKCSVASIKAGFQAVTSKRANMKAK